MLKESLELERCKQDLESFIYVASHDLKTPLRAITAMAQFVREDYEDALDEDAISSLDEIFTRSMRMNKLIEAMLEYYKIGKLNTDVDEFESLMIIEDTVESIDIPESIKVEIVDKENFPVIKYNDICFDDVVTNLLKNCVDHAKLVDQTDAEVKISYDDLGDFHKFSVADNGIGIDAEHHERVFLLFQSMSVHDKVKNIGIGLTTVRKIVEHFGGEVKLESSSGDGAKFSFTVPKN